MGYHMDQQDTSFRIRKENRILALASVQDLYYAKEKQSGGSSTTGEKWFSWVNMDALKQANCLEDALKAWRWDPTVDSETGDIIDLEFCGEKLGDDAVLFNALAPFVEAGSFIEMRGEDHLIWRWAFKGGKMQEKMGKVVFEDEP